LPGLGLYGLVPRPSLLDLPGGDSRCFPVVAFSWKTNRRRQYHTVSSSRTPSCSAARWSLTSYHRRSYVRSLRGWVSPCSVRLGLFASGLSQLRQLLGARSGLPRKTKPGWVGVRFTRTGLQLFSTSS
jgi:hypothetical protein